jgi:hypothetical protein
MMAKIHQLRPGPASSRKKPGDGERTIRCFSPLSAPRSDRVARSGTCTKSRDEPQGQVRSGSYRYLLGAGRATEADIIRHANTHQGSAEKLNRLQGVGLFSRQIGSKRTNSRRYQVDLDVPSDILLYNQRACRSTKKAKILAFLSSRMTPMRARR